MTLIIIYITHMTLQSYMKIFCYLSLSYLVFPFYFNVPTFFFFFFFSSLIYLLLDFLLIFIVPSLINSLSFSILSVLSLSLTPECAYFNTFFLYFPILSVSMIFLTVTPIPPLVFSRNPPHSGFQK